MEALVERVAKLERIARRTRRRLRAVEQQPAEQLEYEITAEMEAEWERRLAASDADPTRKIPLEKLKAAFALEVSSS